MGERGKMKVLLANKYFYRKGGSDTVFFETAEILEKKGHQTIFFSMDHPRNLPCKYNDKFVSHVDYNRGSWRERIKASLNILYSWEARKKIEELIKDTKPDIVHLHNIYHQISPSILHACKKAGIPVVMTLHDYKLACASYVLLAQGKICEACAHGRYYNCFLKGCVKGSRTKSLLNTFEMYLHHKILHIYKSIDTFIAPSRFLINKLRDMGVKGNFEYLPNFVRLEDCSPQYHWEENSIVYIGRLSAEKGLLTLLRAIKDLKITVKIIGDGPLKDEIKRQVEKNGYKNVKLLGYKNGEDLKNEIKNSLFTILPSEWHEVFGLAVIEGFSLGKPAIVSRIGGMPELVKEGVTGLTFEAGHSEELRSKIEYLVNRPDEILRMGKNARAFVEKELTPENYYTELIDIYKRVIMKNTLGRDT